MSRAPLQRRLELQRRIGGSKLVRRRGFDRKIGGVTGFSRATSRGEASLTKQEATHDARHHL
jgi:hypothetical protein